MAAIVNAVWDLQAKVAGKPLWKLLADMTPARDRPLHRLPLHHRRADAGRGAGDLLERQAATKRRSRSASCGATAIPPTRPRPAGSGIQTTRSVSSAGKRWPTAGAHFKVKVGGAAADDARRLRAGARDDRAVDCTLMIDANQRWDVGEAIERVRALAPFDLWWIEEPTSPDDVLGHAAIARGVRADRRRDRRALPEPRHLQAAAPGQRDQRSARSTAAASAASTRTSRSS